MCKKIKGYKSRPSWFIIWAFILLLAVFLMVTVYYIMDSQGSIKAIQNYVHTEQDNHSWFGTGMIVMIVVIIVVVYTVLSFRIVLSHRAEEDYRIYCLPMLFTPVFLICENAMLSLFNRIEHWEFYSVTMGVLSSICVAVITFISLRLSFEISSQRARFNDTAKVKPDISIKKEKGKYYAVISKNSCYLNGLFTGNIERLRYWDNKKTGSSVLVDKLYFNNNKTYLESSESGYDLQELLSEYGIASIDDIEKKDGEGIYLIFRDTQNYYYIAQLPTDESIGRRVFGFSEITISRIIYLHNKYQRKLDIASCNGHKKERKMVKCEIMDTFTIPYSFYPDIH